MHANMLYQKKQVYLEVNLTNFHPTSCFSLMLGAVDLFRKNSLSNNLTFCK